MVVLNVLREFGPMTGFRTYDDGPKSGQEFFDTLLKPKFTEALSKDVQLKIEMDGVEGYLSSFLNEAFRRLGNEFGADLVWDKLLIEYNESHRVHEKIRKAIHNINVRNEKIKN